MCMNNSIHKNTDHTVLENSVFPLEMNNIPSVLSSFFCFLTVLLLLFSLSFCTLFHIFITSLLRLYVHLPIFYFVLQHKRVGCYGSPLFKNL